MIKILLFILFTFIIIALAKYFRDAMDRNESSGVGKTILPTKIAPEYLPYSKKQYYLTYAERGFFQMLQRIMGNQYHIFPQVHYSKLIYANGQQNFKNPYFNKIDRKSADFVLFDKEHVSPVLVIEIDDATHQRFDRMERDNFVDKVLQHCAIPIVHVKPYTHEEALRAQIASKIRI